jgi:hypothetical protein
MTMKKVRILEDTRVYLPKNTVVEVNDAEADRLRAFDLAVEEDEPKLIKKAKKG